MYCARDMMWQTMDRMVTVAAPVAFTIVVVGAGVASFVLRHRRDVADRPLHAEASEGTMNTRPIPSWARGCWTRPIPSGGVRWVSWGGHGTSATRTTSRR
eukprot:TRINITY_DN6918_c0_g1_i1.p3 TRINITY_DN6918_c0_g1~~TRINITY_DN6918_c0_g1_i1.p3  ORF type:complete len:100 (-),score=14.82 TRINITY_DN6918_c0_g1_i1:58-357(-)